MGDFEFNLQRGLLWFLMILAAIVVGMNYWYKVLPERNAREQAAAMPPAVTSHAPATPIAPVLTPSAAAQSPTPKSEDLDAPRLALPDGRTLGFTRKARMSGSTPTNWDRGHLIHPWIQHDESGERTELPPAPSEREDFIAILLADGRLALIGGTTPEDVVALERQCTDCPEVYIPFGYPKPSRTTDIFDFKTGRWSTGPVTGVAAQTSSSVIRLADGRLLRATQNGLPFEGDRPLSEIALETSDAAFTRWKLEGRAISDGFYEAPVLFESRVGAVLLMRGGSRSFQWTPAEGVRPWLEGQEWTAVRRADAEHLQLEEPVPGRSGDIRNRIVELP